MNTMNKIVCAGCAALLAGSALCASIVGEYVGQGEAKGLHLRMLESGHAVYGDPGELVDQLVGTWRTEKLGKDECVIARMAAVDIFQKQAQASVMYLRQAEGGLEVIAAAPTAEAARKGAEQALESGSRPMAVLRPTGKALAPEDEKKMEAYIAVKLSIAEAALRRQKIAAEMERIKKDPRSILQMKLVYPTREEMARQMDKRAALNDELLAAATAFMVCGETFTDELLSEFVEKCDWERGYTLVFSALANPGFRPATLRKFAPRVAALHGKVDEMYLCLYYCNPNTPLDVLRACKAKGGFGEELKGCLEERLGEEEP